MQDFPRICAILSKEDRKKNHNPDPTASAPVTCGVATLHFINDELGRESGSESSLSSLLRDEPVHSFRPTLGAAATLHIITLSRFLVCGTGH